MVALPGFNRTSDNDTFQTEMINPLIIPPANFVRVYEAITWMAGVRAGNSHVWPQLDAVAVTGTHTEADELSATSFPTSQEAVSPSMVAVRAFASDQLQAVGSILGPEQQVFAMAEELRNRIDKDVIAAIGAATNASDNTGANLSLALWDTAVAAFLAQKPGLDRIAFVGSSNQHRDLVTAIRSSGNGGLIFGSGNDVFNGTPRNGYKGMWNGIEIYVGNTTQADADNDAGGFVACAAPGSWVGPTSLEQGGQYQVGSGVGIAMWQNIGVKAQYIPSRLGTDYVVAAMYGAAVTTDSRVRAFISKKAAA